MKLKLLIPLVIFLLLTLFLWHGLYHDPHSLPSVLVNKSLPNFSMPALEEKESITQQDFIGHVTMLNVFATWCLTCHIEHPILMDIADSKKVVVYGVNYKDNHFAAQNWLKKYGNPYQKIIDDSAGTFAINLGVYGTPETFIIDQNGVIRDRYTGPITQAVWRNILLPEIQRLQTK